MAAMSLLRQSLYLLFLFLSVSLPSPAAISAHPFLDRERPIRWSRLTPDKLEPDIQEAMRRTRASVEEISRLRPEEMTYENTFGALEKSNGLLTEGMCKAYVLKSLCDSGELRKAMDSVAPRVSAFLSSVTKDQALWKVLKTAEERLRQTHLTPEQKRYMELSMQSFRDNGADLPPDKRARLEAIDRELTLASQRFNNLYMDARKSWTWTVRDAALLEGIDGSALQQARKEFLRRHPGQSDPGWKFTLDSAASARVMEKARREECRKDLWEYRQSLATGACDTEPVIREILSLRREKAHLCGYKEYPDYALRESMAENGENAIKFVNELLDKIKVPFFREMETLRSLKARLTGQENARLNPWDVAYYANLRAEEHFRLDQEELRRHFPLPLVLDGLFSLAERLYGIRVKEIPTRQSLSGIPAGESAGAVEVWHPDVRFFTIDDGNGDRLGSFYLDIFSRSNKRAGAWMNTLDTGSPSTPETPGKPRLGMVCLNIHPPSAGDTVTLSHREVRTLFHEFGHLLHLMFTRVSILSLAGTSVPRDFVEVPSQFMENWCWRPDVLKSFARHEQTGFPIPEEMLNALDASRGNTPALALAGQLLYAKMDLAVHSEPERFSAGTLDDVDSSVAGDMDYFKDFKRAGKLRTARHLFSSPAGYASFYFSYQWAEVLDKDIFEAFERAGGPDRETAGKFRKTILEKGYAVPPMRQFMDFMGRKPRMDAMLRKRRLAS